MKKIALGIWLALAATMAYASCKTSTVDYNGKFVICTTCCHNGNCNTTCF